MASPQVGVDTAQLVPDPNTGNGSVTWNEHYFDGSGKTQGPIVLQPYQIAEALREIPLAVAVLTQQLTANNNVATQDMLAGIVALAMFWTHLPAGPTGAVAGTPFVAPPLLFDPPAQG